MPGVTGSRDRCCAPPLASACLLCTIHRAELAEGGCLLVLAGELQPSPCVCRWLVGPAVPAGTCCVGGCHPVGPAGNACSSAPEASPCQQQGSRLGSPPERVLLLGGCPPVRPLAPERPRAADTPAAQMQDLSLAPKRCRVDVQSSKTARAQPASHAFSTQFRPALPYQPLDCTGQGCGCRISASISPPLLRAVEPAPAAQGLRLALAGGPWTWNGS